MQVFDDLLTFVLFVGLVLIALNLHLYLDERDAIKRVCRILGLDHNELANMAPRSIQEENFFRAGIILYKRNLNALRESTTAMSDPVIRADVHKKLRDLAYVRQWMEIRYERSQSVTFRKNM